MNRKDRRRAAKNQRINLPMSQQKLVAGMYKNGITTEHLKQEFEKSANAGRCATIKICYAAAILAAKEEYGFGKHRLWRLIKAIDDKVCNALASEEAIDLVLEETGIRLNFTDPFETVGKAQ